MKNKSFYQFKDQRKTQRTGLASRLSRFRWFFVALFWLALWQAVYLYIDQEILLASPFQVIKRLFTLTVQGTFWQTTLFSLARVMGGYFLGLVIGSFLAVGTVRVRAVYALFYPVISAIRATPVSSFIILALVWMTSTRVVIFIVFLMVMPIVWANLTEGIHKTDPKLLEMAHVFRLRRGQIIRHIYLPSVSPFFMSAAITSLGLGWKAGIAAEVLSTPGFSLGGRLYESKIYLLTADLMTFTLVVILLSLLLERVLIKMLRKLELSIRQKTGKGGAR